MADRSSEEQQRKRAIFERMSPRNQQRILQKGYDDWDPFQEPKDPIDIRKDQTRRTSQMLVREFLQSRTSYEYSNAYGRGVLDICIGIINDDERYKGMYDFACWYRNLLQKEGIKTESR